MFIFGLKLVLYVMAGFIVAGLWFIGAIWFKDAFGPVFGVLYFLLYIPLAFAVMAPILDWAAKE